MLCVIKLRIWELYRHSGIEYFDGQKRKCFCFEAQKQVETDQKIPKTGDNTMAGLRGLNAK